MKLYTCVRGRLAGSLPWPVGHPCGSAARALKKAGYVYEIEKVPGHRLLPWTLAGGARAKVRELSGQDTVPILRLDDGSVIVGSGNIVEWARTNPAKGSKRSRTLTGERR
jgi:glutathione S-transferase